MANLSFKEGCCPSGFQTAHILPLLKKPYMDNEVFANYRPISNLSTICKMVERLALIRTLLRINPFMTFSPNFNPVHSAYKTAHPTVTALIKVSMMSTKMLTQENPQTLCISTYQYHSIQFVTPNYSTVWRIDFGVCGVALEWFASYLLRAHE